MSFVFFSSSRVKWVYKLNWSWLRGSFGQKKKLVWKKKKKRQFEKGINEEHLMYVLSDDYYKLSWKKKLDCIYKIIYTAGPCEGYLFLSYVMFVWGLKKKWKERRNLSWLLRQKYLTARVICLLLLCAWVMLCFGRC